MSEVESVVHYNRDRVLKLLTRHKELLRLRLRALSSVKDNYEYRFIERSLSSCLFAMQAVKSRAEESIPSFVMKNIPYHQFITSNYYQTWYL